MSKAYNAIEQLKSNGETIPVCDEDKRIVASLQPVTYSWENTFPALAALTAKWRNQNRESFYTQFIATEDSTRAWLNEQILARKDRILFYIIDQNNALIGHIGYANVNECGSAEVDSVLRGESSAQPRLMEYGLKALLAWGRECAGFHDITLSVFRHNKRAIRLYEKCGFVCAHEIPLLCAGEGRTKQYKPAAGGAQPDAYALIMKYAR